ncbi:MAG: N-acetylmuramidase family protein [Muribaculaceae bacterium]|nr:N-acetylmuramidase family protein [Muribaculaceae bacterium]
MEEITEEIFEDNLDSFQRGILSVVDGGSDFNDIVSQDPVNDEPGDDEPVIVVYEGPGGVTRKNTNPVKRKFSLLGYLGTVKMEKDKEGKVVYNPKAWLLQTMLNELKYPLNPDGYFGPQTDEQVKKFQADNALKLVDGVVGPVTWKKLINQSRNKISSSKISDQAFVDAAEKLKIEVEVIQAITKVEASGSGYVFSHHPAILFESHMFWKELNNGSKIDPKKINDKEILNPTWEQGQVYYVGGVGEWARLKKARDISCDAANASASWGLFQIMGNNYKACGCNKISEFVDRMKASEGEQLNLFVEFIKSNNLHQYLKPGNIKWAEFAKRYNGTGYWKHGYHTRLQEAYEDYKK